jgi:hypothetical protein
MAAPSEPAIHRRIATLASAIDRQEREMDKAVARRDRGAFLRAGRERARLQGRLQGLLEEMVRG